MNKAKARTTAQVLRNAARIMEQGEHVTPENNRIAVAYPCWCIADANGVNLSQWDYQPETAEFLAVFSGEDTVHQRSHEYLEEMRDNDNDFEREREWDALALCLAAAVIESGGL